MINKSWAQYLLQRMSYVKRKACSKAKVTVSNFDEVKANFLYVIKDTIEMEEIQLAHQFVVQYVPLSSWTMAELKMC